MSDPRNDNSERPQAGTPVEPENFARARRGRNIAIALGLVAFIIIVFFVTIVKLGANVADRPF